MNKNINPGQEIVFNDVTYTVIKIHDDKKFIDIFRHYNFNEDKQLLSQIIYICSSFNYDFTINNKQIFIYKVNIEYIYENTIINGLMLLDTLKERIEFISNFKNIYSEINDYELEIIITIFDLLYYSINNINFKIIYKLNNYISHIKDKKYIIEYDNNDNNDNKNEMINEIINEIINYFAINDSDDIKLIKNINNGIKKYYNNLK